MLAAERQEQIVKLLKEQKSVVVSELAERFYTSEATIRRDLDKINKLKIIKRTYGGAVLLDAMNQPLPHHIRQREHWTEKSCIGALASRFVNDFDVIVIDSSSTAFALVSNLTRAKNLTIITNGVKATSMIGELLDCNLFCTGGECYDKSLSLIGSNTEAFMRKHNAQKLFFSCNSITSKGYLANATMEESNIKNVMIEQCEENYMMCDTHKLGVSSLCNVCSLQKVDNIILEKKPPAEWMRTFERYSVRVIYPGAEGFEDMEPVNPNTAGPQGPA